MSEAPRFSPRLQRFFARYLERYFRRHFSAVRILKGADAPAVEGNGLFYSNHPSWWDPIFLLLIAAKRFPGRATYGPIDAEALTRYRFLERLGLFGVPQDDSAGIAFVRAAKRIYADPTALICLTAEGAFTDVRPRPVTLEPGTAFLARRYPSFPVFPIAIEYAFWDERLPEALIAFGPRVALADADRATTAAATDVLAEALSATMDRLSAASVQRDPELFDTVLDGRRGVGGVYDRWRQLKAGLRGERFDPGHRVSK